MAIRAIMPTARSETATLMLLRCGQQTLDLRTPVVMGVLNVTADSFSDGGRFLSREAAVDHGLAMAEAGAAIIDVGGESTRPGAAPVSEAEELDRVIPVIEKLAAECPAILSIDTSKPAVMLAAVQAGAYMINDVHALRLDGALSAAASTDVAVCLVHMLGEPRTMQDNPQYEDVVTDVRRFLGDRVAACKAAGIDSARLILDPGIGFGKRHEHNLALLARLPELQPSERERLPMLVGVSRKHVIGVLTGRDVGRRLYGGVAVATAAILGGASIIRTHDVEPAVDAVRVAAALQAAGYTRHTTGEKNGA